MPENIRPSYIQHLCNTCHQSIDLVYELLHEAEFEKAKKVMIDLNKFLKEAIKDCQEEIDENDHIAG